VAVALRGADSLNGRPIHEINKNCPGKTFPFTQAQKIGERRQHSLPTIEQIKKES